MHQLSGNDCLAAWKAAVEHLLSNGGEAYNLLVEVVNPCDFNPDWVRTHNARNIVLGSAKRGDDLRDVIHTIFPMKYAALVGTREELYSKYLRSHFRRARLAAKKKNQWGTYFLRLICFEQQPLIRKAINPRSPLPDIARQHKDLGADNQIENVIHALGGWKNSPKAAIYCHISGAHLDTLQPLGSPCLQYVQFTQSAPDTVDMTVVYRSHDYFNKALGNFIGLGQLLGYVCEQSGKNPGKLTCHAIRAYSESSQKKLKELLGT